MDGERVQKLLARVGAAPSRRKAEELIRQGRVTVDGAAVELGARVPPGAEVRVDGHPVAAPPELRILVLHKPPGVLTTMHDPQGRPTVTGLVPAVPGLHPVGRLDRDSEGLLLLTNDGGLTLRLTHPRYEHRKRYRVWCAGGTLTGDEAARLVRGVELEDGAAVADRARPAPGGCTVELHEGRNRQVRRMLTAIGREVTRLVRTHHGPVALGELAPGAWRDATEEERAALGYDLPR